MTCKTIFFKHRLSIIFFIYKKKFDNLKLQIFCKYNKMHGNLPSRHDGVLIFSHADVLCDVGVVVTWHSRSRVIGLAYSEEERCMVTSCQLDDICHQSCCQETEYMNTWGREGRGRRVKGIFSPWTHSSLMAAPLRAAWCQKTATSSAFS